MVNKVVLILLVMVVLAAAQRQGQQTNARRPKLCSLPLVSGPCEAYIPRFGFVPASGSCQRFIYGGCGGNANNFRTKRECEATCKSSAYQPDYYGYWEE